MTVALCVVARHSSPAPSASQARPGRQPVTEKKPTTTTTSTRSAVGYATASREPSAPVLPAGFCHVTAATTAAAARPATRLSTQLVAVNSFTRRRIISTIAAYVSG